LQGAAGAKARSYLRERGLSARTQQEFRLGYAPDSRNALKEHLAAKGVDKAQIEACGLVVHGPDISVSYDRFRDRVTFPILDARGRVIAFGGRALSADAPAKYLNSNDTELFHKGNVLYNFARARKAMGRDGRVIAVEGYMDVIGLAQAGIDTAVAPLGTALTENQLELLWRMNGEPVLCFDGDEAGLRAAQRAADLALPMVGPGRSLRFALLPQGKDPDDLVREEGAQAFRDVIGDARPLADMIWMRETAGGVFDTPERRAELEKRLREVTSRIRDESVRFHYAQEMRERVQAFFGQTRGGGGGQGRRFEGRPQRPGQPSRTRLGVSEGLQRSTIVMSAAGAMPLREATILVALVNHPQLLDENFEIVERLGLAGADARRLHGAIIDAAAHGAHDRASILAVIARHGLDEVWDRASGLVRRARVWPALEDANVNDARDAFLQALHLQQAAHNLHRELKAAETALAADPTEENYRNLVDIQAQMRGMQTAEALIDGFGVESGRVMRN
jgi:DNA primase